MIYELVQKNRSYRGYDASYRFTRQQLEAYVECARLCPSSVNLQPLKYYIAWEEDAVAGIQKLTHWARALPQLELPHPGKCPTAFIVICQDEKISPNLDRFQKDVGIVAQTMLLAATEEGLGGIMIGNFSPDEMQAQLGLSQDIHPLLVVAFGKPAEDIRIVDVPESGSINYYRDENDVHYVPKRALASELLN